MDLQLERKTAVVTGSTAGIGLAVAEALAHEGAEVTIVGRHQARVDAATVRVREAATGPGPHAIVADLATAQGTEVLLSRLTEVDILVNNLGIYGPKPFAEISDDEWLRFFEINVLSGVRTSRHYLPGMLQRNWGRIIFVSSESAIQITPEMIHYAMTKTSQLALMRGLAELTRGTGVTVNAVLPGPTRSEGIVEFFKQMSAEAGLSAEAAEEEFFRVHRPSSLLQRLIEPQEVASLVTYLASPLAAATNGASVKCEGGLLRSII